MADGGGFWARGWGGGRYEPVRIKERAICKGKDCAGLGKGRFCGLRDRPGAACPGARPSCAAGARSLARRGSRPKPCPELARPAPAPGAPLYETRVQAGVKSGPEPADQQVTERHIYISICTYIYIYTDIHIYINVDMERCKGRASERQRRRERGRVRKRGRGRGRGEGRGEEEGE